MRFRLFMAACWLNLDYRITDKFLQGLAGNDYAPRRPAEPSRATRPYRPLQDAIPEILGAVGQRDVREGR
jgi:hypothetical protein